MLIRLVSRPAIFWHRDEKIVNTMASDNRDGRT